MLGGNFCAYPLELACCNKPQSLSDAKNDKYIFESTPGGLSSTAGQLFCLWWLGVRLLSSSCVKGIWWLPLSSKLKSPHLSFSVDPYPQKACVFSTPGVWAAVCSQSLKDVYPLCKKTIGQTEHHSRAPRAELTPFVTHRLPELYGQLEPSVNLSHVRTWGWRCGDWNSNESSGKGRWELINNLPSTRSQLSSFSPHIVQVFES